MKHKANRQVFDRGALPVNLTAYLHSSQHFYLPDVVRAIRRDLLPSLRIMLPPSAKLFIRQRSQWLLTTAIGVVDGHGKPSMTI